MPDWLAPGGLAAERRLAACAEWSGQPRLPGTDPTAREDEMAQTPEDALARLAAEAAIRDVLARYCHAVDDGDLAALGACFADDAELHAFGRDRTGREAITALLDKVIPADRRGKHLTANTVIGDITAGPDGTGSAHASSDFAFLGPDGSVTTGRYEDDLVASGGQWQIATRRILLRE